MLHVIGATLALALAEMTVTRQWTEPHTLVGRRQALDWKAAVAAAAFQSRYRDPD
jgi:hypothetical protein